MGELVEVFRAMRRLGPATQSEISLASGVEVETVRSALAAMKRSGLARITKISRGRHRLTLEPGVTVEQGHAAYLSWRAEEERRARSLPLMQRGAGDRRDDCGRYDECVDAFAHAHSESIDAHCPKACASFERDDTGWKRTAHDAVSRKSSW